MPLTNKVSYNVSHSNIFSGQTSVQIHSLHFLHENKNLTGQNEAFHREKCYCILEISVKIFDFKSASALSIAMSLFKGYMKGKCQWVNAAFVSFVSLCKVTFALLQHFGRQD